MIDKTDRLKKIDLQNELSFPPSRVLNSAITVITLL